MYIIHLDTLGIIRNFQCIAGRLSSQSNLKPKYRSFIVGFLLVTDERKNLISADQNFVQADFEPRRNSIAI